MMDNIQTNITKDISESERFETDSEAQDALVARTQRKSLFERVVWFATFFLILFAMESILLFLGKPPTGTKEGYAYEITLALTGAVAVLLVTTAARLSSFKKNEPKSENIVSSPNLLLSALIELLAQLKAK